MTAQKILVASMIGILVCMATSLSLTAQVAVELPAQSAIRNAMAKVNQSIVQIETIGGRDSVGGMRV
ncbi:MAG: hypothetical protein P8J33_14850, partial [Pirellulaceae bacterium]|nr:hypothetical protein [Pirellulaceae bacterium]